MRHLLQVIHRAAARHLAWLGLASVAAALALPVTALASIPVVSTDAPTELTGTGATLNGTVNPGGEATTYGFYYADANSAWCTSGGTSGSKFGGAFKALGFNDNAGHPVSADHHVMTPGQSLCYVVEATNTSGTATGSQVTFTTPTPEPVVTTGAASGVTSSGATLNGTVNPKGQSTSYQFEYSNAGTEWCQSGGASGSPAGSTSSTALGVSDSTAHPVSASISGLNPGQSLCFRVKASNTGASAVGATASFTTKNAPVVRTDPASSIVNGGATLNGTINSQGQPITGYDFSYAPSTSGFCTSGGISTADATHTNFTFFGFTDTSDHPVSAAIPRLEPSTSYCFRLNTTAGSGSLATFTTGPPVTLAVQVTGNGFVETPFLGGLVYNQAKGDDHQGIECGGRNPQLVGNEYMDCSAAYIQGTVVTLHAKSYINTGPVRFLGWSGACSGTGPTCTVNMSGDNTVGASFTANSSPPPSASAVRKALNSSLRVNASLAAVLKAGGYRGKVSALAPGTLSITWRTGSGANGARPASKARGARSVVVAKGSKAFAKPGAAKLKIKLTRAGRALLKRRKRLKLTAAGTFKPKNGKKITKRRPIKLTG